MPKSLKRFMYFVEKNRYCIIIGCVFLILLIAVFVSSYYAVLNKEGFFLDEIYTFLLSNKKIVSFDDFYSIMRQSDIKSYMSTYIDTIKVMEFTQQDFMSGLSVPHGAGFNFFSVYLFQTFDVHPMLYYSIIHALSSISHCNDLKLIGFSVNIFFQLITCVFLFLMSKKIVDNPWISLIIVAYYGFSFGFQNDSTYFRMYCVLTCWITILCFLYYKIFLNGYNYSWRELFLICIIEYLALSTQYFSLVFIVTSVFLISKNIYHKFGMRKMCSFIKPHVITLIFFVITWPQIIWHFISGSNQHTGVFSLHKYYSYLKLLVNTQFGCSYIIFTAFLLMLVYLYRSYSRTLKWKEFKRLQIDESCWFVIIPCAVTYIIVMILSPWADYRYVTFVMPMFSMFIVLIVSQFLLLLSNKIKFLSRKSIRSLLLLGSVVIVSLSWRPVDNLPHMYKKNPQKVHFSEMYLDTPAIILNPDNTGIFIEIPYHYTHSYYVKIDNSCAKKYLSSRLKDSKYVLYINKSLNLDEMHEMIAQLGYSYSKVDHSTMFHDIYMIECE